MKIADLFKSQQSRHLDEVANHCSQYLAHAKQCGKWLYRGLKSNVPMFKAATKLRQPKDSDAEASGIWDSMLQQVGATALRSNSVFTTSNAGWADLYGEVYVIFPIDGAHYSWTNRSDIIVTHNQLLLNEPKVQQWHRKFQSWLNSYDNPNPPERLGWIANMEPHAQLLVAHDPAKGLHIPPELKPNWRDLVDMRRMIDRFEPETNLTSDLQEAMQAEVEVLVKGTYYALSRKTYGRMIAKKFGVPVD